MTIQFQRHLELPSLQKKPNKKLSLDPAPRRQVRGHMRSQEEGAADVALEGSSAAPPAITPDKTRA